MFDKYNIKLQKKRWTLMQCRKIQTGGDRQEDRQTGRSTESSHWLNLAVTQDANLQYI